MTVRDFADLYTWPRGKGISGISRDSRGISDILNSMVVLFK